MPQKTRTELCTATADQNGIPYNERLRRARESRKKSVDEVARKLGISFKDYYEWEAHEAELNMAMTLKQLSHLSSALGIRTSQLFDDTDIGCHFISPNQLSDRIKSHLESHRISIPDFEEQVGFFIEEVLTDPLKILEWNVDCLRFVCAEIGIDWRQALPQGE